MKNKKSFSHSIIYAELIAGYLAGTLSRAEQDKLNKWLDEDIRNIELFRKLTNMDNIRKDIHISEYFDEDKALENVQKNIAIHQLLSKETDSNKQTLVQWWSTIFRNLNLTTASISFAILLVVSSFIWIYIKREININTETIAVNNQDIQAAKVGATLTLPSGKKIHLGETVEGKILHENGISISKTLEGQLLYEIHENVDHSSTYDTSLNILTTARGETYSVKLPDGSIIDLNSASSIEYPMNFLHSKERRVKLSGEAYFQVAHNKNKPFIVTYNKQSAEVLGTEFNINAYDNENIMVTTLVNGSLRVTNPYNESVILSPGNAAIHNNRSLKTLQVDVLEHTAWRKGQFHFNKSPFDVVARQFSRWYNIDVVYANGKIPDTKFSGEMNRNVSLKTVLSYFTELGINYKLENRKLIIY
ncbi:FecR family protein [Sphingobacterium composti Ten et al. 2007 non Yoo et al. 2007]|uniref:FecR family protein n=1 Tax=Sphingobacterium composti TaxID=363260 RepID=UPI0013577974|nr:FecR domain-containing protein [Sphingobacterium composti Ten et al. 2007 non Yoo et al. 2007]